MPSCDKNREMERDNCIILQYFSAAAELGDEVRGERVQRRMTHLGHSICEGVNSLSTH